MFAHLELLPRILDVGSNDISVVKFYSDCIGERVKEQIRRKLRPKRESVEGQKC